MSADERKQFSQGAAPKDGEPPAIQGIVDVITYHDKDSLYTVLRLSPEGGYKAPEDGSLFASQRITAVGKAVEPLEGQRARLIGQWGRHRQHGMQFEFDVLQPLPPIDKDGLVRYLSSKAFEGIGEVLAKRIVEHLGQTALETIRETPEALRGVKGLRPGVADALAQKVQEQVALHRATSFLLGLELGPLQAQSVLRSLGADTEGLVRDDPYRIAKVRGLGFLTADRVARALGFTEDDPRRLRAGILFALEQASDNGHSLARLGDLVQRARELLGQVGARTGFEQALDELEEADDIKVDRQLFETEQRHDDTLPVYLPWLYASESALARNLARLVGDGKAAPLADAGALAKAEAVAEIELHTSQREAVLRLLSAPVGLLTGGPGVGKTTIVRLIASLAEAAGAKVLLASPTGRAAKRLAEATGRPASTVHRLLKFQPGDEGFQHDAHNPLEGDLIIVDEISMLDVALAHHLVKAVRAPARLVLVGDPDQLPSVGAGHVLADLIASGRVPLARLTHIFRQSQSSLIVTNAHHVLNGEQVELPAKGVRDADFYLFPEDDAAACANRLVEVVTDRIPRNFGFDWTTDVQVLAPMYRGDCGVDILNEKLREAQGIGGNEVQHGNRIWRLGDRVIHTRNDYEKEVFNGDMGRITSVTGDGIVAVKYPEQTVTYERGELSDLSPAFAITVHRSQGGEFPVVVLPLVTQHWMMLQRNLLYTAITRARKLVVLVGSRRALTMAIENADQSARESLLRERLIALGAEG